MNFIKRKLLCYILAHFPTVARQHHRTAHTSSFESCNSFASITLHFIGDNNMPKVFAVDCHMDNRTHQFTGVETNLELLHHLRIAHTNLLTIDNGTHALSAHLFHLLHSATVLLVGISLAQRNCNGMR